MSAMAVSPEGGDPRDVTGGGTPAPGTDPHDRKAFVAQCSLDPGSLCGSWFQHFENNEIVAQGLVVAEPQAGIYLLEFEWSDGTDPYQGMVSLDQMCEPSEGEWKTEWRFYDKEEQMRAAYANHTAKVQAEAEA